MKTEVKTALLSVIGVAAVLMPAGACDGGFGPARGTLEVTSGKSPNASVSGTVTYRERLALTPGATLVVDLRDVSYADGAVPLIARQTISSPGQVPIKYEVGYNRDDIESRNVYSVSVRIVESDGRLAFTNDTAHEVITRGKPNKVDMVLVLVQPPPDASGGGDEGGSDWRTWVETPVPVVWANLIPNEREHLLRVAYYQSTIEGCVRPGNQSLKVDGNDIVVRITLMQPPPTSWAIPCHEQVVELDTVEPIRASLEPGQTYRVIVNDRETTTFTLPTDLRHTVIAESPVDSAEVVVSESTPPEYGLRIVSGLPKGSSCSWSNGYEIRRGETDRIEVIVTHHEVADQMLICTADYPVVETFVPLGTDFEPGVEYTVTVNSETVKSVVAR